MLTPEEKKARHAQAMKRYQQKNKVKLAEYYRYWQTNNPDKVKAQNERRDKVKYRENWAAYYAANKDEILRKAKEKRMEKSGKNKSLDAKEKLLKSVSVYNCFNMVRGL